jgi:hypothetical protein
MKKIITAVAAAVFATAFAVSADAASKKKETQVSANKAAACKAEAKKKYSIMNPLKRRDYEKKCMGTA